MKNIAIFASGEGSNAQQLIDYFKKNETGRVVLLVTNNPDAHVIQRANKAAIPQLLLDKKKFIETDHLLEKLKEYNISFIALAGFIWLIPAYLTHAYPDRIINIHPALLPKYGGKGMYGMNIHQAVIHNKEPESGISIHYVNEHYDEGKIILQVKCKVNPSDTPESLAAKIHQLEYAHYPKVVEALICSVPCA